MTIEAGTRLGRYEVVSPLGRGGMGEVYKGRDTRLGRDVAIKVLPQHLTESPGLRQRFEREARTISQLHHPHICVVYDVGSEQGVDYLVMEYLEGETLEDRLRRGALAIAEVLGLGRQIAEAIEAAHRRGVVHRDLKPGNVMLTASGAKVLDFGLAREIVPREARPDAPTEALPVAITEEGTLLGTMPYMAPEQLRGKPADGRTDLWALGCVLYEMATGERPFRGESQADLIGAILGSQPVPPTRKQPLAPERLDWVVKRCLEKDPERRWQSARDVAIELEEIAGAAPATHSAVAVPAERRRGMDGRRSVIAGGLALAVFALGGVGLYVLQRRGPEGRSPQTPPPVRFAIQAEGLFSGPVGMVLALAPDGQTLIYVGHGEGGNQLFRRSMERLEAEPIPGTEGAVNPFFSPDGRWVGFSADGAIKKVALAGGSPVLVAELTHAAFDGAIDAAADASWGADDTIVLGSSRAELTQVAAAGGTLRSLTTLDHGAGENNHWGAQWLPGGKALLFTANRTGANERERQISLYVPATGKHRVLFEGIRPLYSPSGHIVFGRAGSSTVWAVPFDLARLEVAGPPVPVLDGVRLSVWNHLQIVVGADGSLAYVPGSVEALRGRLVWRERQGRSDPATQEPLAGVQTYRLSPDGRRLAAILGHVGQDQIWVYDLDTQRQPVKLTTSGSHFQLCWTPDGKRIAFGARAAGPLNVSWIPADGSSVASERLIESTLYQTPWSFSPDGKWLLFAERHPESGEDLWLLPLEGSREPRVWLRTPYDESAAAVSPDGRWVAYVSDQYGRPEVFVRSFTEGGAPMPISRGGGRAPVWARDQSELYFLAGDVLFAVRLTAAGDQLSPQSPESVFSDRLVSSTGRSSDLSYDVAPDGRFLTIERSEERAASEIVIVKNWSEELRRLAPRSK